jgi:hypothetical protein
MGKSHFWWIQEGNGGSVYCPCLRPFLWRCRQWGQNKSRTKNWVMMKSMRRVDHPVTRKRWWQLLQIYLFSCLDALSYFVKNSKNHGPILLVRAEYVVTLVSSVTSIFHITFYLYLHSKHRIYLFKISQNVLFLSSDQPCCSRRHSEPSVLASPSPSALCPQRQNSRRALV